MLEIVTAPNSVLSQKGKPVKKIDKSLLNLIAEMKQALLSAKDPLGVGLAGPQVGKSLQIFIVKPTSRSHIQVFINPKINSKTAIDHLTIVHDLTQQSNPPIKKSKSKHVKLEGCLSLPNIWGNVKRFPTITLSFLDEKGKMHSQKFYGFMATIIQHENDHLNGVLFPKRVLEQKGRLYRSHKNQKGKDVFEEIEI